MKTSIWLVTLFLCVNLVPLSFAQDPPEVDGSEIEKQLTERQSKINRLTIDEQLKLRAAQQKAAEDPAVLEALKKRDEAIRNFRQALHNAMVKADPSIKPILDRIAVGGSAGF